LRRPRAAAAAEHRRAVRRRWILLGFAATALAGLSILYLDLRAIAFARTLPEGWSWFFAAITDLGLYGVFLWPLGIALIVLAFAGAARLPPVKQRVLAALALRMQFLFLAIAVPGAIVAVLKRLAGRARPNAFEEPNVFRFDPFVWSDVYASIPSGHTTAAFAAMTAISALWPRLFPYLLVYAVLIGLSRIATFHHFPSDVILGGFAGALGAFLVREYFAARRIAFDRALDGAVRPMPGPSWRRVRAVFRAAKA
jgi:membrane-associated phospholipid phosphatase